jgi:hypothetical protein
MEYNNITSYINLGEKKEIIKVRKNKKIDFGFSHKDKPVEYARLYAQQEERKKKVREARMRTYYKNKELNKKNNLWNLSIS